MQATTTFSGSIRTTDRAELRVLPVIGTLAAILAAVALAIAIPGMARVPVSGAAPAPLMAPATAPRVVAEPVSETSPLTVDPSPAPAPGPVTVD